MDSSNEHSGGPAKKRSAAHRLRARETNESLLKDICVIYESEQKEPPEGRFVAHSVFTDQIGFGVSPLEAYAALLRALIALVQSSRRYPGITAIYRDAPQEVRDKMANAIRVSDDFQGRAFELATHPKKDATEDALQMVDDEIDISDLKEKSDSWIGIVDIAA